MFVSQDMPINIMIDDKVTTRTIVPIQMESILEAIMPFNNNGGHQGIVECSNTKICSAISSTASSLDETKPKIVAVSNHKKPSTVSMNNEHASSTTSKSKGGTTRRRGKWTVEEEEYVARVIQDFNSGFLDAPAGYTLRSFLSDKLQCDPMRITKKFTGDSCIGKRVFHPAVRSATNSEVIDTAQVCVSGYTHNCSSFLIVLFWSCLRIEFSLATLPVSGLFTKD